jgi:cob(I)alamin adenosyltransferase
VSSPRVYTRSGDSGETGLLFGGRVSKADLATEAYGTIDEAVSMMGLGRALSNSDRVKAVLLESQRELFHVASELATAPENRTLLEDRVGAISPEMIESLEARIDALKAEVELPRAFIVPGASPASAAIDVARTMCRTAERRIVALKEADRLPNDNVLRFVNRMSDLLFVLARYEDRALPFELTTGEPPTGESPTGESGTGELTEDDQSV